MTEQELYKQLEVQQMNVYADMLDAYRKQANLYSSILESLTFADFSDHDYIRSLYKAIQSATLAAQALGEAFHSYAQSHNVSFNVE
jgi:hypothetical protein